MSLDAALSVPAAPARSPARTILLRRLLLPVLVIAILIALWDVAIRVFAIPAYVIPAPGAVGQAPGIAALPLRLRHGTARRFSLLPEPFDSVPEDPQDAPGLLLGMKHVQALLQRDAVGLAAVLLRLDDPHLEPRTGIRGHIAQRRPRL